MSASTKAAVQQKSAKKAPAKAAPKKAAKKPAKATKEKAAPRTKKEGLRKPQVRVLQALAKANKPLNRAEIAEKGGVDLAMLNSYIGSHDEATRKKNDAKVCVSLLTLGYVKHADEQAEGRGVYYAITPTGKAALSKAAE
jgi:DNA-binding MarR family transcriptional regulator